MHEGHEEHVCTACMAMPEPSTLGNCPVSKVWNPVGSGLQSFATGGIGSSQKGLTRQKKIRSLGRPRFCNFSGRWGQGFLILGRRWVGAASFWVRVAKKWFCRYLSDPGTHWNPVLGLAWHASHTCDSMHGTHDTLAWGYVGACTMFLMQHIGLYLLLVCTPLCCHSIGTV